MDFRLISSSTYACMIFGVAELVLAADGMRAANMHIQTISMLFARIS